MYIVKEDLIFKEFIKCVINFVKKNKISVDLSQVDSSGITADKADSVVVDKTSVKDGSEEVDKFQLEEENKRKKRKKIFGRGGSSNSMMKLVEACASSPGPPQAG